MFCYLMIITVRDDKEKLFSLNFHFTYLVLCIKKKSSGLEKELSLGKLPYILKSSKGN